MPHDRDDDPTGWSRWRQVRACIAALAAAGLFVTALEDPTTPNRPYPSKGAETWGREVSQEDNRLEALAFLKSEFQQEGQGRKFRFADKRGNDEFELIFRSADPKTWTPAPSEVRVLVYFSEADRPDCQADVWIHGPDRATMKIHSLLLRRNQVEQFYLPARGGQFIAQGPSGSGGAPQPSSQAPPQPDTSTSPPSTPPPPLRRETNHEALAFVRERFGPSGRFKKLRFVEPGSAEAVELLIQEIKDSTSPTFDGRVRVVLHLVGPGDSRSEGDLWIKGTSRADMQIRSLVLRNDQTTRTYEPQSDELFIARADPTRSKPPSAAPGGSTER